MRQFINNNHCQPSQLVHLSTFALNHDTLPEIIGFALCSSTIICKHGCMVKIIKILRTLIYERLNFNLTQVPETTIFCTPCILNHDTNRYTLYGGLKQINKNRILVTTQPTGEELCDYSFDLCIDYGAHWVQHQQRNKKKLS